MPRKPRTVRAPLPPLAWLVPSARRSGAWRVVEFRSPSEDLPPPLLDRRAAAAALRAPIVAAVGGLVR